MKGEDALVDQRGVGAGLLEAPQHRAPHPDGVGHRLEWNRVIGHASHAEVVANGADGQDQVVVRHRRAGVDQDLVTVEVETPDSGHAGFHVEVLLGTTDQAPARLAPTITICSLPRHNRLHSADTAHRVGNWA